MNGVKHLNLIISKQIKKGLFPFIHKKTIPIQHGIATTSVVLHKSTDKIIISNNNYKINHFS